MKKHRACYFLVGMILLWGCNPENPEPVSQAEKAQVEKVRPAAKGGSSSAYFSYENDLQKTDTLWFVRSGVAGMSQVHESYETGDGMRGMREQDSIIVKSGEALSFERGGLHIMLMQLNKDLQAGDSVEVELHFAEKGTVIKRLEVRP